MSTRRDVLIAAVILPAGMISGVSAGEAGLDLFEAAAAGDVTRATSLLDADPKSVRLRAPDGRTPLHFATAAGKPDIVNLLLGRGAELSAGPESPLLAAVDHADHALASAVSMPLLANGSDPGARRRDGTTALQLAAARGHSAIVTMLLHRGAAVPAGETLPEAAGVERAYYGRRYLHDVHGKPVTRDDSEGLAWTQINQFVTLAHFDFDKVKQLHADTPRLLNTRSSWDELAVEASAHTGQFAMAEWLAAQGAPVSTCTAVLLGLEDMVMDALAADARCIHERGAHDFPILAYAAYAKEQATIARMLLRAGANPQTLAAGITPLHMAASKGYVELAAALLDNGAEINAEVVSKGEKVTPLAVSIKNKQPKMEQFLRDRGAI